MRVESRQTMASAVPPVPVPVGCGAVDVVEPVDPVACVEALVFTPASDVHDARTTGPNTRPAALPVAVRMNCRRLNFDRSSVRTTVPRVGPRDAGRP